LENKDSAFDGFHTVQLDVTHFIKPKASTQLLIYVQYGPSRAYFEGRPP